MKKTGKAYHYDKNEEFIKEILPIILGIVVGLIFSFPSFVSNRNMGIPYILGYCGPVFAIAMYVGLKVSKFVIAVIYPIFMKGKYFAKEQGIAMRIASYQSKFHDLYKKHGDSFGLIDNFDEDSLGIKYIFMDNDSKYDYYTRKDTEIQAEKVNKRISNLENVIDLNMKSPLTMYSNMGRYNVNDVLAKYSFGELEKLIKFSRLIINDYRSTFDAYNSDKIGISLGKDGEDSVNKNLEMYNHRIINLSNMRFEVDGNSIETDNLVLSPTGIYSLEVKNLGSSGKYGIRVDRDGKWNKVRKGNNGSERSEVMDNVTNQTYRHIAYTEKLFNSELRNRGINKDIKVEPLIVFANDNVSLENNSDMPIVRTSNIYREISKGQANYSDELLGVLKDIALKNTLPAKVYKTVNIVDKITYINNCCDKITGAIDDYRELLAEMTEIDTGERVCI